MRGIDSHPGRRPPTRHQSRRDHARSRRRQAEPIGVRGSRGSFSVSVKAEQSGGSMAESDFGVGRAGAAPSGPRNPLPLPSLPKGGGAIRDIGEKFSVGAPTGTASFTIPIFTSPGRASFHPELSLTYDSGNGNGLFGLGWSLSVPAITRKTDKGLPRYADVIESDVFLLSGAEDFVPAIDRTGARLS